MFNNIIEIYSGHIQVQNEEFWEDRVVDNTMLYTLALEQNILSDKNVKNIVPRFESFALASSGSRTKGVMVMGIDPVMESELSDVQSKLVKYTLSEKAISELVKEEIPEYLKSNLQLFNGNSYSSDGRILLDLGAKEKDTEQVLQLLKKHASVSNSYLEEGKPGALVGNRLAKYLGLQKGDTIVLLGQGYHGTTAAGKYVIRGVVSLPAPDLEGQIVYLPLDICQSLYGAEGMLTSMAVLLNDKSNSDVDKTISRLETSLDQPYRVLGWREMNETVVQQMEADNQSGMIMIGILYLVIAFGVFGTVLMMTTERRREFGVLVSIGMQKTKLAAVMVYEMLYIGLAGILLGIVVSTPVIIYGFYHPIRLSGELAKMMEDYGFEPVMAFQWIDTYFLSQSLVVGVIVVLSVLYPVRKILRLKEINAIRA
jgi:ABC-type lipoprotein release transport system permease subunit